MAEIERELGSINTKLITICDNIKEFKQAYNDLEDRVRVIEIDYAKKLGLMKIFEVATIIAGLIGGLLWLLSKG